MAGQTNIDRPGKCKNSNHNIRNYHDKDVNFQYNWWGTTNTNSINQSIYDYYDDFYNGKVIYKPFLTSPVDITNQKSPENKSNQPPIANAGPNHNQQ